MHPEVRVPQPGACPICGMALIPVQVQTPARAAKPVKYACSMMCVPPLDKPGKCPVCGMDMVPVEDGGSSADESDTSVTLSPRARRLAEVAVAPVERKFAAAEIRMVGKVEYDETRVRSINSRVAGRLDRLYVDYTGVPVRKGDHLVYLYSPALLSAQEELLQAVRGIKESESIGIAALRDNAAESLTAVRAKLMLWGLTEEQITEIEQRGVPADHITIYAPMGGVVIGKDAVEGMYVEMGTRIYTIADLSRVWVKLDAYESDLGWIRYGQEVEFQTEAYPGETFHGTIAFIDPVLNDKTRTVKVRVNVENADGRLKPAMFVRAQVRSKLAAGGRVMEPALAGKWMCPMHPEVVKEAAGACEVCGMDLVSSESLGYVSVDPATAQAPLVIPVSAPLITGRRAIVYVARADEPGTYDAREVSLGPRAGDFYLVQDGLREGESVAVQGALQIDSAMQILGRRSMMSPQRSPHRPAPGEGFNTQLDAVLTAYFVVQEALSHDRFADVGVGAQQLLQGLEMVDGSQFPASERQTWTEDYAILKRHAAWQSSAKDVEPARAAFEHLSSGLIAVVKRYGTSGRQAVRVYHCPMAFNNRGADWIQSKDGIENPYFGAAMFTCGVLKEVIHPGPGAAPSGGSPRD